MAARWPGECPPPRRAQSRAPRRPASGRLGSPAVGSARQHLLGIGVSAGFGCGSGRWRLVAREFPAKPPAREGRVAVSRGIREFPNTPPLVGGGFGVQLALERRFSQRKERLSPPRGRFSQWKERASQPRGDSASGEQPRRDSASGEGGIRTPERG